MQVPGTRLADPHIWSESTPRGKAETTKAGNPSGSPAFRHWASWPTILWAKGDLNPHVPKDTGT